MSEKVYRWLLQLYPRRFRDEYGAAAVHLFQDRLEAESGVVARIRFWVDMIGDLAVSVPREYRRRESRMVACGASADPNRTPLFQTLESDTPRVGALLHGGVLSFAVFLAMSLAVSQRGGYRTPRAHLAGSHATSYSRFLAAGSPSGTSASASDSDVVELEPRARTVNKPEGNAGSERPSAVLPRLLWLLSAPALSQSQPQLSEPIVIGERIRIHSAILQETRPLLVAKPAGYEAEADRYPVLYLLDGDAHFHHTTGIVSFLAESGRIPKMLVVAIPNTSLSGRARDLTPPTKAEMDLRFTPVNGGADNFLRFLTDELMPYVEKNYRTRPYRILAGHSFGGLFAIHTLTTRPRVFNAYIAIDPSLHWNNQELVSRAEAFFGNRRELDADLYMTEAGEGSPIRKLAEVLKKKSPKGFRWSLKRMPEENHLSIPHRSIYLGLDAIFDRWHLTHPLDLYDKGGIEAVHRHFREGGQRAGYDRETPAFTVSIVVHELMGAGRLEEAARVLLHDPKAYPPPWNQLDALARAYAKRGDTERAIRYYTLSLRENPGNEWARKKLAELGAGAEGTPARWPE